MQLTVIKSDGTREVYFHTKVMGSVAAAMGDAGCYEPGLPEQLSEAVTTFLIRRYGIGSVSSDEIHSMIEAVLSDTGYEDAALALHEHRIIRQLKRDRIEVIRLSPFVSTRVGRSGVRQGTVQTAEPWNKTVIVRDMEAKYGLEHYTARCIAGNVEEKVLRMNCRYLTASLVRELVLNELYLMRQAEKMIGRSPEGLGVEEKVATVG
jgi:hypothetical protein